MAQAIFHTFTKEVCHRAKRIERDPSSPLVPKWLQILNRHVTDYLAQVDRSTLQRRFFAWELYKHHQNIQDQCGNLVFTAKKVQRAARYLEKSLQEKPEKVFFPSAEKALEEFDRALQQNDNEKLHSFSRRLKELCQGQIDTLFYWAVTRWDRIVLHRILKHCELSAFQLDLAVEIAFDRKAFGVTLYALMLFHFEALSPQIKKAIEQWLDKRGPEILFQEPVIRIAQEEKEGESNVSELFEALRKAMHKGDLSQARVLIQTPAFAALPQRDAILLLQELFDYPEAFTLLGPYSDLIQLPLLRDLIYYGIQNKKWKGTLFLMETRSFRGLGIHTLCELDDLLSQSSGFEEGKAKALVQKALDARFAKR